MLKMLATAALVPALPSLPAFAEEPFALTFPQDPVLTRFTSSFGDGRSGGRSHKGTDLMAPKMSPVYAAAGGVVTIAKSGDLAGRWVAIKHTYGWETWYMHLNNDSPGTDDGDGAWEDTLLDGIEEGAVVAAGQQIGWVGDSGNAEASGSHTHFELHRDGRAVDPYPYLVEARDRALADLSAGVVPTIRGLIREAGSTPPHPGEPRF